MTSVVKVFDLHLGHTLNCRLPEVPHGIDPLLLQSRPLPCTRNELIDFVEAVPLKPTIEVFGTDHSG